MVFGEGDGLAGPAEDTAGITSIGDVILLGSHEDDIGRATGVAGDLLVLRVAALLVEFLGAVLADDELVHELEGVNKGLAVVGGLVGAQVEQLVQELGFHELADLMA